MMSDNPYAAPQTASPGAPGFCTTLRTLFASVMAVFATTVIGGVLGLATGAFLGIAIPNYYRSVFSRGDQPGFDPVAVGIGLGLTQGAAFGGLIGVALVALFYWSRSREARGQAFLHGTP